MPYTVTATPFGYRSTVVAPFPPEEARPWFEEIKRAVGPTPHPFGQLIDARGQKVQDPASVPIVEEAQNLTPHELKTVVTRCGEGTKIVLTGDPFQIDNPYVDASTNGLTVTADRLRGEPLVGHLVMSKGERSELANIAANKL